VDLELLATYGLPGLLAGILFVLLRLLIERGFRFKIEAEIPAKRR
jgi:hypothetical protein